MVRQTANSGTTRKIVAYYLLFCLLTAGWLGVGFVVASHLLGADRIENNCLSQLGQASTGIEMHWLREGFDGVDSLVQRAADEIHAVHVSVVGVDGRVVAHSDLSQIGKAPAEPTGSRTAHGEATSVRYIDDANRLVREFRTPLVAGRQRIGELRVAIEEPNLSASLTSAANVISFAALAPLGLVGLGAYVLWRIARPLTGLESRLRELAVWPLGEPVALAPIKARDAMAVGWNRLVEEVASLARQAERGSTTTLLATATGQRSSARFEEVLQRLSDGIAVTDAAGRIAFANQAIATLLGTVDDLASLEGSVLAERLKEASAEAPDEFLSAATRQRTASCEVVQKIGEAERVLRVARYPLGADGAQTHVWSLRDVTQQKLAEQTRDRFIDTATHELRTPMANIKAYAETLATADEIDVELQKDFCNIINSEVTRLARFIDDLLSISSMEVGSLTVDRQKVETERLFAEVLAKVEPLMQKKGVAFEPSLPPKLPELTLDKDKIISVIVNVLGNAAKYTPSGGRVSMRVKCDEQMLRVAVQDSGVGIAPDELAKVFDKFFRSADPRVQAETGSGLGLSLAREIVRMHGGEIIVESVLDQGSVFTISLPLA